MVTSVAAQLFPKANYLPIDPDAQVIPAWRINSDVSSKELSKKSDRQWNLDAGTTRQNGPPSTRHMNFDDYPPEFAGLISDYSWLCMNFDHFSVPGRLSAVRPEAIKREATSLLRYLRFMRDRKVALEDVTDEDNDAWMGLFRKLHYSSRVRAAGIPKRLYLYRRHIASPISDVMPWIFREPNEVLGRSPIPGENTTERIPRTILEPMLKWALFYIEVAFDDVMRIAKATHAKSHDNLGQFACIPSTKVSWRRPGVRGEAYKFEETHHLVTAGYIITAYLSGMRDGELQAITAKSRRVKRDKTGQPYRYMVRSLETKNGTPGGIKRVWVVPPEVYEALEKLEKLSDLMRELDPEKFIGVGADLLFRRYSRIKSAYLGLTDRVNPWLKEFEQHVNALAKDAASRAKTKAERDIIINLYVVPACADGTRWQWTSKQFRRTIAWYIATEPFGIVAGMRQFGHVRDVTFQGYAGRWKAGFRDEIAAAAEVGKMRDLLETYEHVRDGGTLGGPKGKALEKEFDRIAIELGDLPGKVVDHKRLLGMLKNVAVEVYPGLLNDCFFDSATALCLKRPNLKGRDRPYFAQCDWEKCPNSCFWHKHRAALQSSLNDAEQMNKNQKLSKNQRSALNLMIGKYSSTLSAISNGS